MKPLAFIIQPSKGREVETVRATSDRRLAIRDYISDKRHTTISELMQEFDVSKSTVLRDLAAIAETTSYYTTPGNGGGIHATDGWYASQRYLSAEQEALLKRLSAGLQPEDKKLMDGILASFGKPRA
jgi:predicted DNA-binding transcriptional regulator YafY